MTRSTNVLGTLNSYLVEPDEILGDDRYGFKVIAGVWPSWNGWCAFRGPTDWSDQAVLSYGDEIPFEAAKLLFPTLSASGRVYSNC